MALSDATAEALSLAKAALATLTKHTSGFYAQAALDRALTKLGWVGVPLDVLATAAPLILDAVLVELAKESTRYAQPTTVAPESTPAPAAGEQTGQGEPEAPAEASGGLAAAQSRGALPDAVLEAMPPTARRAYAVFTTLAGPRAGIFYCSAAYLASAIGRGVTTAKAVLYLHKAAGTICQERSGRKPWPGGYGRFGPTHYRLTPAATLDAARAVAAFVAYRAAKKARAVMVKCPSEGVFANGDHGRSGGITDGDHGEGNGDHGRWPR